MNGVAIVMNDQVAGFPVVDVGELRLCEMCHHFVE